MRVMKEAVIEMFDRVEKEVGSVEVVVFNAGAQHRCSILNMTARVYRQVWESATFAGFIAAARRRGEWLLKAGEQSYLPVLLQACVAVLILHHLLALNTRCGHLRSQWLENGTKGIHVGHVIVDGMIDRRLCA